MAYTFTRTGAQIEEIHNTVEDPKSNTQFSDDIRTIAGEYRGLWPDTGGSANKGDTYQTQVSGTGTGQYFTALQNTTADPVGDNVNWREVVSGSSIGLQEVTATDSTTPRALKDRFAEVINVKDEGAVGGGVIDDSLAIEKAILRFRSKVLAGEKVVLDLPCDTYRCSGKVLNFSGLGTAQSIIRGNGSIIEFDDLGGRSAVVDFINSKELSVYDIRFRYGGDFDRSPSECPEVGLLFARNSSNDYSGRHKLFNVFVTGTYQLSAFYNAGCEENSYYHVEFRNNLQGRRACVVTSSNHLGATSEFEPITTTNISTTLNVFTKPVFWTDGRAREAVCLRGVGGLTMTNPYSSSGAIAHYALQAIDSTVSGVSITGYQAEVDRGSIGVSADYIFRFEGDGTLDVTNCDIKSQFSTKVLGEGTIEGVRDFKRNNITVGGLVRDVGASDSIQGCDIRAAAGITLNSITEIVASNFYSDLKSNINLPNVSSNCTVTATDIEGELSIGKFKQKSSSTTVTLDASVVGIDGGGTVESFNSDFNGVGMPFVEQRFYCYGSGANITISHGTGNILTNTQADLTLATGQYLEVRYLGHADKYFVRRMTE